MLENSEKKSLLRVLASFFFQAEDGIRDGRMTGVQTCALPISRSRGSSTRARAGVAAAPPRSGAPAQIGRASCRERVDVTVAGGSFKKKLEDAIRKPGPRL